MQTIKRTNDILNKVKDIEEIFTFKQFPIYMGVTESPIEDDIFVDMKWGASKSTGIVQLMDLIPLDLLYRNFHNPGVTGGIWEKHHKNFADFIKTTPFTELLEIGGATGSLFNHFLNTDDKFTWNVLEPSGSFEVEDERVKVISDYFEESDFDDKKFDIIAHSHVLEHIYDPILFLRKSNKLLHLGGYQYISIPNMKHWLKQCFTNTLMFEHTYYIDDTIVRLLLESCGFEIEDMIIDEHSIFIKAQKVSDDLIQNTDLISDTAYIKNDFINFINVINNDAKTTISKIEGKDYFLFGAHIFSQTFLNLGLPTDNLVNILDNNKGKQGKRLYGTNVIVESPDVLKGLDRPIVVLRAGAYTDEIYNSIMDINPTTIFY